MQFGPGHDKVLEKGVLILGVRIDVDLKGWVLEQRQVGNEHHGTTGLVTVLGTPCRGRFRFVRFAQEFGKVGIVKRQRLVRPGPFKAGTVAMALPNREGTA